MSENEAQAVPTEEIKTMPAEGVPAQGAQTGEQKAADAGSEQAPAEGGGAAAGEAAAAAGGEKADSKTATEAANASGVVEEEETGEFEWLSRENWDLKAVIKACEKGDGDELRNIIMSVPIQDRVDFVNQYDEDGNTPIFFSLEPDQIDCLVLLLDYGADAALLNHFRNTPLHLSCEKNHKRAIRMIIDHGGDITVENKAYHKCHQMVHGAGNVMQMQAFLNQSIEQYKTAIKDKELLVAVRPQRSYIRSLFDLIDIKNKGSVHFQQIVPLLQQIAGPDQEADAPPILHMLEFYKEMDIDKNGILTFKEFFHTMMLYMNTKNGKKGKKGGKGKKGKKGKKK